MISSGLSQNRKYLEFTCFINLTAVQTVGIYVSILEEYIQLVEFNQTTIGENIPFEITF